MCVPLALLLITELIVMLLQQLIFPGVGAFSQAMNALRDKKYAEPLAKYIASGKP